MGDWYEVNLTTGVATAYYSFNGQAVALKQGNALSYLHRDQVGSIMSVSDASANEVASLRYWPFGGTRTSTGSLPTDRLFTGQSRDLGDDRFYFSKARFYDATIGKFHTPDSLVPDASNPQALNRYAYGLNNLLRYADPSGHLSQDQIDAYLQQQYGDKWQTYLSQWKANTAWWAAITTAQPGDYLRSDGQYGRLMIQGLNGYSLAFDKGKRQEPLTAWAGRDVDLVLHQRDSHTWNATWTKPAPPDDIPLLLDSVAFGLGLQAGTFVLFAVALAPIPVVGDALAASALDVAGNLALASGFVGVASAGYTLAAGGLLIGDHRAWISEAAGVSALSGIAGFRALNFALPMAGLQLGADALAGSSLSRPTTRWTCPNGWRGHRGAAPRGRVGRPRRWGRPRGPAWAKYPPARAGAVTASPALRVGRARFFRRVRAGREQVPGRGARRRRRLLPRVRAGADADRRDDGRVRAADPGQTSATLTGRSASTRACPTWRINTTSPSTCEVTMDALTAPAPLVGWIAGILVAVLSPAAYGIAWYKRAWFWRVRIISIPLEYLGFVLFGWATGGSLILSAILGFLGLLAFEAFMAAFRASVIEPITKSPEKK